MISRLKLKLLCWALNLGWVRVAPEEDPRRSPVDQDAWRQAGRIPRQLPEPRSYGSPLGTNLERGA